jgi:dTDP-4-dehydrorhamnose reductase
MSRRLLVTGGSGFVAGSVICQGWDTWEVHAISRGQAPVRRDGFFWHPVSVTDAAQLRSAFETIGPDAVIHTAAIADIDYSQSHRDEARQVNVEVTRALAGLCREAEVRFVFTSTDTVFDGERAPYAEADLPQPVNFYGETKVEAERFVAQQDGKWVIARLALVMGLPVLGPGNSFLARMMTSFKEGKPVGVPPNEIRTPVDVITLGQALLELAGNDVRGTIHLSGNETMNRVDMARRIAARLGYSPDLIVPNDPSKIPGRAPRPRDVSLNNLKARTVLKTPMKGLDEAVDLVLKFKRDGGAG